MALPSTVVKSINQSIIVEMDSYIAYIKNYIMRVYGCLIF